MPTYNRNRYLPDGSYTTDADLYWKIWSEYVQPVEKALGCTFESVEGSPYTEGNGATFRMPDSLNKVYLPLPALHNLIKALPKN